MSSESQSSSENLVSFHIFQRPDLLTADVSSEFRTFTIQAVVNLEVKEQITFETSRVLARRWPSSMSLPIEGPRGVLNDHLLVRFNGTGLQR